MDKPEAAVAAPEAQRSQDDLDLANQELANQELANQELANQELARMDGYLAALEPMLKARLEASQKAKKEEDADGSTALSALQESPREISAEKLQVDTLQVEAQGVRVTMGGLQVEHLHVVIDPQPRLPLGKAPEPKPEPEATEPEPEATEPEPEATEPPLLPEEGEAWVCTKCGKHGTQRDFGVRTVGTKVYRQPQCRDCRRDAGKQSALKLAAQAKALGITVAELRAQRKAAREEKHNTPRTPRKRAPAEAQVQTPPAAEPPMKEPRKRKAKAETSKKPRTPRKAKIETPLAAT